MVILFSVFYSHAVFSILWSCCFQYSIVMLFSWVGKLLMRRERERESVLLLLKFYLMLNLYLFIKLHVLLGVVVSIILVRNEISLIRMCYFLPIIFTSTLYNLSS